MKIVLLFAVITVAVSAVTGYDFDDSEYNSLLSEDLEELYSSLEQPSLNARNRRDEEAVMQDKCRGRRKKLCCGEIVWDQFHEEDKEVKRACFKELHQGEDMQAFDGKHFDHFKCENVEKHRKDMVCLAQCSGQKKNLLDDAGNVREEDFTQHVKSAFANEPWFQPLQDKIIETCLADSKVKDDKDSEANACNPAGLKLMHCMFKEIQLSCPTEQIKDPKSCSRLQERLKKGGNLPPPPPPTFDE
ncbi:unnamed protein product [Brassicogethes aeneus]|uniref:Uncharacterized protein n=1 Tax=Brassicogethes aeneus TaxID=1431903 RepID=A0A9P0FIB3_BRAAE|nr:unnamed protein product [Brassicogethes aeneus]